LLGTRKQEPALEAHFPGESTLSTETPEPWTERVYQPAFSAFEAGLHKLRWLQHGRVQLYVLYITLTILFLLVWYLGWET